MLKLWFAAHAGATKATTPPGVVVDTPVRSPRDDALSPQTRSGGSARYNREFDWV